MTRRAGEATPNELLRAARGTRTQEHVAERLRQIAFRNRTNIGVTAKQLSKWERGIQTPGRDSRTVLCDYYGKTPAELGLQEDPPDPTESRLLYSGPSAVSIGGDDMDRRGLLFGLGGVATASVLAAAAEPWERLVHALRRPASVDRATVDQLEQVTISLEELEAQMSPKALLGPVLGHLSALAQLLHGGVRDERLRRRMCSLAGETAGLAGWLVWDLDAPEPAAKYFYAGLEAAQDAGDRALGAYLVGSAACQPSFRERPAARLRQLMGTTFGFKSDDATPATRAWLATLEVEAHALEGKPDRALVALDRAETAMAQTTDDETRPRVSFFDRIYLTGERGVALSRIGHGAEAKAALGQALRELPATRMKTRPRLLTALAHAHVQDGEVDEACRITGEAFTLAVGQQVAPNFQDVRGVRQALQPWADSPHVRQLDERLKLAG